MRQGLILRALENIAMAFLCSQIIDHLYLRQIMIYIVTLSLVKVGFICVKIKSTLIVIAPPPPTSDVTESIKK